MIKMIAASLEAPLMRLKRVSLAARVLSYLRYRCCVSPDAMGADGRRFPNLLTENLGEAVNGPLDVLFGTHVNGARCRQPSIVHRLCVVAIYTHIRIECPV